MIFSSCKKVSYDNYNIHAEGIKNIIILIGDGMGKNHIENTKTYFELGEQSFEKYYITDVNTNSLTVESPTDSAAGATALATGVSVTNGRVGYDGKNNLKNIMEYASDKNMKTGIVTNDYLFGATPAGYSSHASDRTDVGTILATQSTSPLDLLIGQYHEIYYEYEELFTSNDFVMCDEEEELYSIDFSKKVIANLDNIYSIYNPEMINPINMVDLAEYAIDYLDNDNGFVLMIECAYIDKFSHANEIIPALSEVRTLFDIADYVLEYIKDNEDTALIITADHETGGLIKAESKENVTDSLYTSDDHSAANVSLYSIGIGLDTSKVVRNTFIFIVCYKTVSEEDN